MRRLPRLLRQVASIEVLGLSARKGLMMAVWNPKPLSWGERMELAQSLRKEAAEKIAEAQRIEDGLSADQDAVYAAVEAARARIEAKKVGASDTAHVCGLQGFGQAGDECPACARPNVGIEPRR